MSLVSANTSKGEKSKKFQSLNINNIYQVSGLNLFWNFQIYVIFLFENKFSGKATVTSFDWWLIVFPPKGEEPFFFSSQSKKCFFSKTHQFFKVSHFFGKWWRRGISPISIFVDSHLIQIIVWMAFHEYPSILSPWEFFFQNCFSCPFQALLVTCQSHREFWVILTNEIHQGMIFTLRVCFSLTLSKAYPNLT